MTMSSASIAITPFARQHRQAVDDLLFNSYQVHTHMDWFDPIDWLDRFPQLTRLAWQGDELAGVLGVSAPFNGASWLRIAAVHDDAPPQTTLTALWDDLIPQLSDQSAQSVSLLMGRNWIKRFLLALDFRFVEDVVTMQRTNGHLPPPEDSAYRIRVAGQGDLHRMAAIDSMAFKPPWQMTLAEIRQAQRTAEFCTVAELDQQIVGFQISTLYRDGAHLARLAVDPAYQRQGIGSRLVQDILRRFMRHQLMSITVNTQASNLRSQRLYHQFGFSRNGYDLPVWSFQLPR